MTFTYQSDSYSSMILVISAYCTLSIYLIAKLSSFSVKLNDLHKEFYNVLSCLNKSPTLLHQLDAL